MVQLYQSLSQSFTDQAACFKHCQNPLQFEQDASAVSVTVTILYRPSRVVWLYQSLLQSFTDQAGCFSCVKHCQNPLQIEQDVSAASVTVTILYRTSRMVQPYQSLSQSFTERAGCFSSNILKLHLKGFCLEPLAEYQPI
jgi:hypothetical protein